MLGSFAFPKIESTVEMLKAKIFLEYNRQKYFRFYLGPKLSAAIIF
jgi:hypothetical protein